MLIYLFSGGKGGAPTINTDHQFNVALSALLKRKLQTCFVSVEFHVDEMIGFRIRRPDLAVAALADPRNNFDELVYGNRVCIFPL